MVRTRLLGASSLDTDRTTAFRRVRCAAIATLTSATLEEHQPNYRTCVPSALLTILLPRLSVSPECITAFNELKLGRGGVKYVIYKISDDLKEIVVDETGKEPEYDTFREKLLAKKEKNGKSRPSYAVYDVEYDLGDEGKR